MKTINLIGILAIVLSVCQSCQNQKGKNWDAKASADTLNNMKDSVADTNKSITNGLLMKVDKDDAKFAVEAANGGMTEVVLGNMAMQKGSNEQVKNFGQMMVKDHSAANEQLMAIAKSKNISLPKDIGEDEQKIKNDLSSRSGSDFDKAYVKDMVEDHQNDVKSFELAIKECKDPELKAFAEKTLPKLKMHLDAIEKIQHNLK